LPGQIHRYELPLLHVRFFVSCHAASLLHLIIPLQAFSYSLNEAAGKVILQKKHASKSKLDPQFL
jgi:hypothetical protein